MPERLRPQPARPRAVAAIVPALLLAALASCPSAAARPASLARGFADDTAFRTLGDGDRRLALSRVRLAGGSFVRLAVSWRSVAPQGRRRPRGFRAADPRDPRYAWGELDRAVREAAAAGLQPVILVNYAPRWAEGRDRPRRGNRFTREGVWRPQPRELAAFLRAASHRYGGTFPDPAVAGADLPRVRNWQVWNEPNLWPFLQPQWERRRGHWVRAGAHHYRRMLNASYRALKQVDRGNRVIAGGLAPFGDPRPTRRGGRVAPVRFFRALLCLSGRRVLRRVCRARASFDSYAFHPYSLGGPRRTALNPDDTTIPDGRKLTRVMAAALRAGTAFPRRPKSLWVTEMGWDTRPPNPFGLRPRTQARYLNDSLFVLWRSGVGYVTNFLLRDSGGPRPRRAIDPQRRQSGVFYRRRSVRLDRRKPSFHSMRFPFVVTPLPGGRGRAWGVPPCSRRSCTVVIERRADGRWIPVATVPGLRGRVFLRTVRAGARTVLRGRIADAPIASLTTVPRRL